MLQCKMQPKASRCVCSLCSTMAPHLVLANACGYIHEFSSRLTLECTMAIPILCTNSAALVRVKICAQLTHKCYKSFSLRHLTIIECHANWHGRLTNATNIIFLRQNIIIIECRADWHGQSCFSTSCIMYEY